MGKEGRNASPLGGCLGIVTHNKIIPYDTKEWDLKGIHEGIGILLITLI